MRGLRSLSTLVVLLGCALPTTFGQESDHRHFSCVISPYSRAGKPLSPEFITMVDAFAQAGGDTIKVGEPDMRRSSRATARSGSSMAAARSLPKESPASRRWVRRGSHWSSPDRPCRSGSRASPSLSTPRPILRLRTRVKSG